MWTLLLTFLFAAVIASPVSRPGKVHEKRDSPPPGWREHGRMAVASTMLPVKIALTQPNLDKAHDYLMDVSHPSSEQFGQHWTAKKIAETFSPSQESIDTVKNWLVSSGIADHRISQSQSLGWLQFDATVTEAERILNTEYYVYKHARSGQLHVACSQYSIPEYVRDHVDFITPTVHFDVMTSPEQHSDTVHENLEQPTHGKDLDRRKLGLPSNNGWLPKPGKTLALDTLLSLVGCDLGYVTPACLQLLYTLPTDPKPAAGNSFGIVEYTPQSYVPSDLDTFFQYLSAPYKVAKGTRPTLESIDGGSLEYANSSFSGFDYNGESDLDLEYAITLTYPQPVTLYQVGDVNGNASFNNFLDALDGSYCTSGGGDNPNYDGQYPDPLPGGYKGPETCGGVAAAHVISTSYGLNEADTTPAYEQRQCNEYMKLGLMGVSVLYSSGDYGVAGNGGQCINADGSYNSGTSGRFNPSFPGTCPYVTSVGATQINPSLPLTQPTEMACEQTIYSGGGFSNVFAMPAYQSAAVASYYKTAPPPYTAAQYNNSQQTRAYPDVSANGANYIVVVDGSPQLVYGTSASSPTFASVLTLINGVRIAAGKGPVGFVNPTLYANPGVLNDITSGDNPGCGTNGFTAVEGWDPVTGLGTPNYPNMLKLFTSLP